MLTDRNELFPVVDPEGNIIGSATRAECHSGSMLLHPVVHLHIMVKDKGLYLQKRSLSKDIQPGKWDTAVGGHVDLGESVDIALHREASEELGFSEFTPRGLEPYVFQSTVERELIFPFVVLLESEPELSPDADEISEGRFWQLDEIDENLGKDIFTPNFENEYKKYKSILSGITLEIN